MFKSKTFIGLSIALSVIFSSCEFFNTSVPDWFREYTDYPSVSDSSWAGKGKKDSSGVINAASSEDFTVTIRLKQPEKKREIDYENKTLKNCAMCNYFLHGAMLLNPYSNFLFSFLMPRG